MIKWRRRPDVEIRGAFFYLRVDDRLIHGQVVIGWGAVLNVNRLILANDRIAANADEREFYRQLIPESMGGSVETLAEAIQNSVAQRQADCRCIAVVVSVEDAKVWIEEGRKPDALILGGLHAQEGRKRILDYLYLSNREIAILEAIENQGVKVICRDLPTSNYQTLQEALQK